jgi:hypothetical protein
MFSMTGQSKKTNNNEKAKKYAPPLSDVACYCRTFVDVCRLRPRGLLQHGSGR